MFKIESIFPKSKKIKKKYFVSAILASEDVAINSQLRREYFVGSQCVNKQS